MVDQQSGQADATKWIDIKHLLGLNAPRIVLRSGILGKRTPPCHFRVEAPSGMVIDDVDIVNQDMKSMKQSNGYRLLFHHARVTVFERDLPEGSYALNLKINPKRGPFLYPALVYSVVIFVLSMLGIFAGPRSLAETRQLAAVMLIVPSAAALFVIRDTEHEIVSKLLGLHRRALAVAGALAASSGGLIAIFALGEITQRILFFTFLGSTLISGAWATLLSYQTFRIGAMRKAIRHEKLAGEMLIARVDYLLLIRAILLMIAVIFCVFLIIFKGGLFLSIVRMWLTE